MKYFRDKYSEVELTKKSNWADIYSAINNETNEKVQLRILRNKSNNEKYINSITREINELQGLRHKNLISVNIINKFIENQDVYYYIETEHFDGKALSDKMILNSHTSKESLEIIKQVAKGLNEFHYRGLSYETLSAENVFINSQGLVKVDVLSYIKQKYDDIDEYDEYDEYDECDELEDGIDEDIYSLGVILYQLITRDQDFALKKLKKSIEDDEVYSMLYALTSKKKKYKYENLNVFLADINEYLQHLSSDSGQDIDEYKTDDYYENKKSAIIKRLCTCIAIILVLGSGIKVMGLVKSDKDKDETTVDMAIEEESSDKEIEKQEPEKEEVEQPEDNKIESTDNTTINNIVKDSDNKENTNTTENSNKENTTTNNSVTQKPSGNSSTGSESTTQKPSGNNSTGSESTTQKPSGNNSTGSGSTTQKPSGNNSTNTKPSGGSDSGSSNGGTSGGTNSGSITGGTSGETDSGSGTGGTSGETGSGSSNGGTSGAIDSGSGTGGTSGETDSEGGNQGISEESTLGSEPQMQEDTQALQELENIE